MNKHKHQRIFIALFSSHVDRIIDLIRLAFTFDRKILISGTSMKIFFNSIKRNKLNFTKEQFKNIFFYSRNIKPKDNNKFIIFTSGCQAEGNTKLVKSLYEFDKNSLEIQNIKENKLFKIQKDDVIIFSAKAVISDGK